MVNISLPDGSVRSFDKPVSGAEIAASIGPGLAKAALALKVDGKMVDLSHVVSRDAKIGIVTARDPDALELLRHDAAHVLAQAVQELYPGTQITFGPSTEDGFYYDFVRDQPFSPEDFARIEQRMAEIVDRDLPIVREVWDRAKIKQYFVDHGEKFKAEWADELPKDEEILAKIRAAGRRPIDGHAPGLGQFVATGFGGARGEGDVDAHEVEEERLRGFHRHASGGRPAFRQVEEDRAALTPHWWRIVVAKDDDHVIGIIFADQAFGGKAARQTDRPVIGRVHRIVRPAVC